MTKDEALKSALEALEAILGTLTAANEQGTITDTIWFSNHETLFDYITSEIDRIKEALAQPEQEPVAWLFQHDETGRMNYVSNDGIHNPAMFLEMNPRYALVCPLYTTPPQRTWVGLTEEKRTEIRREHYARTLPLMDAVEAKLKELNHG